jgi:hypothetical protein
MFFLSVCAENLAKCFFRAKGLAMEALSRKESPQHKGVPAPCGKYRVDLFFAPESLKITDNSLDTWEWENTRKCISQ